MRRNCIYLLSGEVFLMIAMLLISGCNDREANDPGRNSDWGFSPPPKEVVVTVGARISGVQLGDGEDKILEELGLNKYQGFLDITGVSAGCMHGSHTFWRFSDGLQEYQLWIEKDAKGEVVDIDWTVVGESRPAGSR